MWRSTGRAAWCGAGRKLCGMSMAPAFAAFAVLACWMWLLTTVPALAQVFPVRPVRIVVPFPPGDSVDLTARMIAPRLTELLGQPVIVENIVGGSGQVGIAAVARAAPDGHTIAAGQAGNLIVIPHTFRKVPYDTLKNLTAIALTTTNYQAIVANLNAPFRNFQEMVAYAKANPGKLALATNGEGGYPHLTFEDLRLRAGFSYLHVPYKGSVQVVTDLLGGQVQAAILGISPFAPHLRSGKLRLLAVTYPTRPADWPEAQTVAEVIPGFSAVGWFGYVAPAGTPPAVVQILNTAINRAINEKEVADKLAAVGLTVVAETPAYFDAVLRADHARYGRIVKDIGFEPQ